MKLKQLEPKVKAPSCFLSYVRRKKYSNVKKHTNVNYEQVLP